MISLKVYGKWRESHSRHHHYKNGCIFLSPFANNRLLPYHQCTKLLSLTSQPRLYHAKPHRIISTRLIITITFILVFIFAFLRYGCNFNRCAWLLVFTGWFLLSSCCTYYCNILHVCPYYQQLVLILITCWKAFGGFINTVWNFFPYHNHWDPRTLLRHVRCRCLFLFFHHHWFFYHHCLIRSRQLHFLASSLFWP